MEYVCFGVGLDARAAAIVMRVLRNTVNTGRTVVCTIHCPPLDLFQSFDEMLLLNQDGKMIFFGALGANSCLLVSYLEVLIEKLFFSCLSLCVGDVLHSAVTFATTDNQRNRQRF